MSDCIILPIGITRGTIESILSDDSKLNISCITTVTVPGMEEEKERIISGVEILARMINAELHKVTVRPWDPESVKTIYNNIKNRKFNRLIVVGITGTRYLQPILLMVALRMWRELHGKSEVLLLQGVEGEEARLVPLLGFIAPALRISRIQRRLIEIVYSSSRPISGKDLIKRQGFTKSVYYVLADLEHKGLLKVKRGIIERTWPGELYYRFMKSDDI
ncbi:MAG: hypothetical protein G5Z42_01155 [Caldisphaeraceae archaeon]|nr:hypothetical protein [Caldisphaeraceae archaeon]MEB3797412.1 hypothetical protein [Caldisphaeraceae archaeon]